ERLDAPARPQLGGSPADVGAPGRYPVRIALVAGGISGAVEVEPKHRKPRLRRRLGEMAEGAVRADHVLADGVAEQHPHGAANTPGRRMEEAEQGPLGGSKIDRYLPERLRGHRPFIL